MCDGPSGVSGAGITPVEPSGSTEIVPWVPHDRAAFRPARIPRRAAFCDSISARW
jgi:hypothetical protein